MVRLKVYFSLFLPTTLLDFNSTMVRLKAESGYKPDEISTYFNSTMVRLKESRAAAVMAAP